MGETKLIRREAMETVPQFPQEIFVNILSRLPVKYLIQLKCVCKPWRSLISDPHFAKLHLAQSKKNNLNCDRFLFMTNPLGSADCEDSGDDHDLDHVNHLEYPAIMKNMPGFDKMVCDINVGGFCNGLICVAFPNGRIFLWNPTIGEAMELENNNGDSVPYEQFICGLGYDFSVDDYKVLKARYHHQAVDDFLVNDFEVLAFKSNVWCRVEGGGPNPDYIFERLPRSGIFSRGALHWIVKRPMKKIRVILGFDTVEEKLYELVELPDCIEETKLYWLDLINSGDSLFIFCCDSNCHYLEAWHLKEYGVQSSWTKIFSNRCTIPEFRRWGNVLHYTKTGKLIFESMTSQDFVWYDLKENTWKMGTSPIDLDWFRLTIYFESLVLPDWYRPTSSQCIDS